MDKFPKKRVMCLFGFILGTAACYVVGTAWLAFQLKMNFASALVVGVLPFLAGDVIKIAVAMWIGTLVRRQMNKAGYCM